MLAGIPIHTAMKLTIDQDKCIHCHLCEKACFLTRFCGFDSLEGAAEQYCIGCGHCDRRCPFHVAQSERMQTIREYFGE